MDSSGMAGLFSEKTLTRPFSEDMLFPFEPNREEKIEMGVLILLGSLRYDGLHA